MNNLKKDIYWQEFTVQYRYPVAFCRNVLDPKNMTLLDILQMKEKNKRHKVIFVIDEGLNNANIKLIDDLKAYIQIHASSIDLVLEPIIIKGGEDVKISDKYYWEIMKVVNTHKIDRHSYLIGIGGGAILDLVGLVAATAHRGVRHIRVPTTVLSQNDSGVGVKNSINYMNCKNFIGSFAPPWAVICDFNLLNTLSKRDKISGISEAVKVALIRDAAFFTELEQGAEELARFEPEIIERMVRRSAEIHMKQIAFGGDPFETGSSRPLDFGHWSAHKLEPLSNYKIRHGEAVAIGMALDARYSVLTGLLAIGEDERIAQTLEKIGFNLWSPLLIKCEKSSKIPVLISGLQDFREHLGGELTVTLLSAIGKGIEVHEMDLDKIMEAIEWLKNRSHKLNKD